MRALAVLFGALATVACLFEIALFIGINMDRGAWHRLSDGFGLPFSTWYFPTVAGTAAMLIGIGAIGFALSARSGAVPTAAGLFIWLAATLASAIDQPSIFLEVAAAGAIPAVLCLIALAFGRILARREAYEL